MTYPIQTGSPFRAAEIGEAAKHSLFAELIYGSLASISLRSKDHSWIWLHKFNTAHTGTTLRHLQNWLCRSRCLIPLRHLATTSPLRNISWRHPRFSLKHPEPQLTVTPKFISSNGKHDFRYILRTYLLRTSNDTRCYSQLYHNFQSFTYFFPFPRGWQHKNSIYHAAIKNYPKNISTSWNFSSLYISQLSEETTQRKHTHAHVTTFPR